jgi:two-component system, NarL family, nitrate/nitrite response regulator NarL
MSESIRILLIDDHVLVREGIARLLTAQPDFQVAGEASTVDEGIEVVKRTPVDVVLLDINLGTHQGGAFLDMARAAGFSGRVLVVTAGVSKLEANRLLQKGHSGIFLKHESPPLLIERIRALAGGKVSAPSATCGGESVGFQNGSETPRNLFTTRERQVLQGVFAGLSNKEIASEMEISEALVKAFVQQLFQKTGVRSRAQLVRVAMEKYWKTLETDTSGPGA